MAWHLVCIGPGPGPKNVLAERDDGYLVVVPYAIWKHRLKGERVSDKVYVTAVGVVQKFGDKPAIKAREASGQTVHDFTIKTGTQQLLNVTIWPEFDAVVPHIAKGCMVGIEGSYTSNVKNGVTYHNISATSLSLAQAVPKTERPVVNAQPAAAGAAAPAASPLSF